MSGRDILSYKKNYKIYKIKVDGLNNFHILQTVRLFLRTISKIIN